MKPFLSELQRQLDLVKEKIQELEDAAYHGPLSPRFRKQDIEDAKALLKRKDEIEDQIVNYRFDP